jgi:hypothetical protein
MTKVAGDFHLIGGGGHKLVGASIKIKSGSKSNLIMLPTNNSSAATTKLMTLLDAVDKLTEGNIRGVTTNLYVNTADSIPDDKATAPRPAFISATAVKHSGGVVTPGFRYDKNCWISEPNLDVTQFNADGLIGLNTAQKQFRNMIDLMFGSYYGATTTKIKKRAPFNTALQASGGNPTFTPSVIFDAAFNAMNPLPETYIRYRIGDRTFFLQIPHLNFGNGAGVDDYDLTDPGLLFTDAGINSTWTGKTNLTTLLAIAKISQAFCKAQIQAIGMQLVTNSNADIPYDIVGREATKPIKFRVTNVSDRTQRDEFELTIPRYSNWTGLDQDEVADLIKTDIGGYFTSIFSSSGTDEVEVLF